MEVSIVDNRNFLIKLNTTESNFVNELAVSANCKTEKVIADLTFIGIVNAHAQMKVDEMIRQHEEYWDI